MRSLGPSFKRTAAAVAGLCMGLAALVPLASCGPPAIEQSVTDKIDLVVSRAMVESGAPGAIIGVWLDENAPYIKAFGKADTSSGTLPSEGAMYRIGDITKSFTASVVLQLVDEKRFLLDDKLDDFVTGVPFGDRITITQLLNMTSGVFSYTEDPAWQEEFAQDRNRQWTSDELLAVALKHQPYFAPGEGWHYSDTNYVLLEMIVSKVTGAPLALEIQHRITEPYALGDTSYPKSTIISSPYIHGYSASSPGAKEDLTDVSVMSPTAYGGAGALVSSLEDQKEWARVLGTGDLFKALNYERQMTFVKVDGVYSTLITGYGLGVMRFESFIGHSGDIPGYSTATFYSPRRLATISVVVNKQPNQVEIAIPLVKGIAKVLYPDMKIEGAVF